MTEQNLEISNTNNLVGFKGWLLVYSTVLSLLLVDKFIGYFILPSEMTSSINYSLTFISLVIINYLLYTKNKNAPIVIIVFSIIISFLLAMIVGVVSTKFALAFMPYLVVYILLAVYFSESKRVKNTFVN